MAPIVVSCPRRHGLEHLRLRVDLCHDGVGQVLRVDLPLQEVRDELVARLAAPVRQALRPVEIALASRLRD